MRFKTAALGSVLLTALPVLQPRSAQAADFVPAQGKVVFAAGEVGLRFEPGELAGAPLNLVLYGGDSRRLPAPLVEAQVIASEPDSIEGGASLELGGAVLYGRIDLRAAAPTFTGRRVEIRYWQRSLGSRVAIWMSWLTGDVAAYLERDQYDGVQSVGYLAFQPTGRATDDGWQEWTSGPLDFALGGRVPPAALSLYDETTIGVREGVAALNAQSRVRVDALSIIDLGPALVPAVACRKVDEAQSCGDQGTCLFGQCVDAATVLGPVVQAPALREAYLDRYTLAFTRFEGGRAPLAKADQLRAALGALKTETSPRRFRNGIAAAVYALGDGHASPPLAAYLVPPSSGVCAYLGEADLLPLPAEVPLVFEASAASPLGAMLAPGDALTAIDGLVVSDWAALARPDLAYGGDPAGRTAMEAAALVNAALRAGSVLHFERCATGTSSVATPCAPGQEQVVEVDTRTLAQPIWEGQALDWMQVPDVCDFRLRRALEGPGVRDYAFAGSIDEDGARILQINGVPAYQWQGGVDWFAAVDTALAQGPERVILDQRLGQGGSPDAVDRIAAYLLGSDEFAQMQLYPNTDGDVGVADNERLLACAGSMGGILGSCGDFGIWPLGMANPNVGAAQRTRLAVVDGLDVSGNDFLPRLLSFRRLGATRFFGPAPTYGAFGAISSLPALLGEISGGSYQVHDTVFLADAGEQTLSFNTSTGVAPDERVLQKQSDAVRGVDTILERAKAWVLQ